MPTSTARRAWSRLIAPAVMSAVPSATRLAQVEVRVERVRTPTSTTVTLARPAAEAFTTAPPARKFATICAVTSCGGVTLCVHAVVARNRDGWVPAAAADTFGRCRRVTAGPRRGRGRVAWSCGQPVTGGHAGLGTDGTDGGGGVGDDVGGGHPESRPRPAADGQRDFRLASGACRKAPRPQRPRAVLFDTCL